MVEVLSSWGEEDTSFDVDELMEMIAAYVPEFTEIDRYWYILQSISSLEPTPILTCCSKEN